MREESAKTRVEAYNTSASYINDFMTIDFSVGLIKVMDTLPWKSKNIHTFTNDFIYNHRGPTASRMTTDSKLMTPGF